ncbi:hypothetical protein H8959_008404, partial [Pygathrix nigripes]
MFQTVTSPPCWFQSENRAQQSLQLNTIQTRKQCNPSSNAHGISLHDWATFAPMFKECSSVRFVDHLTGIPAPNGQSVKLSFHWQLYQE